jgi:hypothetical protein
LKETERDRKDSCRKERERKREREKERRNNRRARTRDKPVRRALCQTV